MRALVNGCVDYALFTVVHCSECIKQVTAIVIVKVRGKKASCILETRVGFRADPAPSQSGRR